MPTEQEMLDNIIGVQNELANLQVPSVSQQRQNIPPGLIIGQALMNLGSQGGQDFITPLLRQQSENKRLELQEFDLQTNLMREKLNAQIAALESKLGIKRDVREEKESEEKIKGAKQHRKQRKELHPGELKRQKLENLGIELDNALNFERIEEQQIRNFAGRLELTTAAALFAPELKRKLEQIDEERSKAKSQQEALDVDNKIKESVLSQNLTLNTLINRVRFDPTLIPDPTARHLVAAGMINRTNQNQIISQFQFPEPVKTSDLIERAAQIDPAIAAWREKPNEDMMPEIIARLRVLYDDRVPELGPLRTYLFDEEKQLRVKYGKTGEPGDPAEALDGKGAEELIGKYIRVLVPLVKGSRELFKEEGISDEEIKAREADIKSLIIDEGLFDAIIPPDKPVDWLTVILGGASISSFGPHLGPTILGKAGIKPGEDTRELNTPEKVWEEIIRLVEEE